MALNQILSRYELIDLTHPLDDLIPTWNGSCGFRQEIKMDYAEGCRVHSYKCHAGGGTHMDAPSHFFPDGNNIGDIPLNTLIVPACVLNVSAKRSADLLITVHDLGYFEERYGVIAEGSLFFAHTGWGAFWSNPERYRNEDASGIMRFPAFSKEAAEFLLKRNIVGIGIDTLSPDPLEIGFPVHHLLLGRGKYILENVANLDQMPPVGSHVINFPMNVRTGTEAAVRLVGLISRR